MAKIPLRSYNREIENLINRGQIDEAIGHCKNILRFFPKHIDTYRLLGKAFLEGQHYAEASDVIQRVLSAVPDDFVSQIGMSIIREDEGNLDAAIWHMEHAFEVQPANTAVQGELRRLYGRRDGIEPPKVRLTRGALVRMYARGELYQQAIGEIRTALSEDPKRVDLEVILARMYFLSGLKVEATEVCSRLISKLPFCFEANRILAEILPETARAEDAKVYQQRVDAMDPYAAYISPNAPSLADVPDNVVTVERLEWESTDASAQKPDWARTVGIDWEEQQDALPEWMAAAPEAIQGEMPIVDDVVLPDFSAMKSEQVPAQQPEKAASEDQEGIPDWMQAAGWGKSTGEEQPPSESAFLEENAEEELAGGNIPEWLQAMAPQAGTEEAEQSNDQGRLDLLSSILPGSGPFAEAGDQTGEESRAPAPEAGLPDWMSAGEASGQGAQPFATFGSETPDWLSELAATPSNESSTAQTPGEMPAWLQSEEPEAKEAPISALSTEEPEAQSPVENVPENPDDAFAWLESLAAKQGAEEETLLTKPEDRVETTPDWLSQVAQPEDMPGETSAEPAAEAAEAPEGEMPDWLKDIQIEPAAAAPAALEDLARSFDFVSEEETASEANAEPELVQEDVPDWLKDLQATTEVSPVEEAPEPAAAVAEEPGAPAEEITPALASTAAPSEAPAAEDDAFAWLESLAARQGAEEETLLVKPEERQENPPEWVQQQMAAGEEQALPQGLESVPTEEAVIPSEEAESDYSGDVLPDWMKPTQAEAAEAAEGETVPDWLKEVAEELPAEQQAASDLPDWLRSLETTVEETSEPVAAIPEVPAETQPAAAEAPSAEDDAFAWLESLAAKQGADEETLLTRPEDRVETPPEWVAEKGVEPGEIEAVEFEAAPAEPTEIGALGFEEITLEPITEEEIAPEAAEKALAASMEGEEDVPDWLKNLEIAPEETAAAIDAVFAMPEPVQEEPLVEAQAPSEWMQEIPESPAAVEEQPLPATEAAAIEEEPQPVMEAPAAETPVVEIPVAESRMEEEVPVMETTTVQKTAPIAEAPLETTVDVLSTLNRAKTALNRGKVQEALADYLTLIKKNQALEEIVQDLENSLYQHPVDIDLWQAMGDAYAHSKRLQDALDAYTKAEELLR